jgi:hypothetical protein
VPKPKPPHTKLRFSPAGRFRHTGRSLTRRHGALRRMQTARKGGGDIHALWLEVRVATGLARPSSSHSQSLSDTRDDLGSVRHEERKVVSPPSPPNVPSAGTGAGNPDMPVSEPPDISVEFQSEMAAIRAHYAARIAAARRGLPMGDVAVAIKAILNEETIALRAVTERWRAAAERQKQEKPQRPTGNVQRKDDPKPS